MHYQTTQGRILLLLSILLFLNIFYANAQQPLHTAAANAYTVVRMAEKFHLQPRPLNAEFSANIFSLLLKELDADRIIFTQEDIKALSVYKFTLDEEIKNKKSTFLSTLIEIYDNRITKLDTMITSLCKSPLNFSLPEKITVAEDTSYPADEKSIRAKLHKAIKNYTLHLLLEDDNIISLNQLQQKKYLDSAEPVARHKTEKVFKHSINVVLQNAGGVQQAIGNEYCKAIALCYDPHTEYFPLTEKEDFDSELGDKQMVFGFSCKEEDDGSLKVDNISPGSPAFKSGQINKGDKLLSIQWENKEPIDISTGGLKQLYDVIAMSNHDKATLKIKKPDGSERAVVLFKEKMEGDGEENKVKSFLLKGTKVIGFISLPAFYQDWEKENNGVNGCANDVAKEILKLKKENIEGLIIDLRYNGGGSMEEAIELSGIFIDAGPVGQEKTKDPKVYTLKDVNRGTVYDGPLILLVNGYSASASEMVAGTLQDYHRAVIIGSPTYGKATAQVMLPMDTTINVEKDISKIKTDSYIKVTISELYRVNGTTAQAAGVQPDIVLPDLLEAHPEREGDNANVLIAPPIDANKYFKPYPAIDLNNLKALAKTETDSSLFFTKLKEYIKAEKLLNQNGDINLKLSDVIAAMKNETATKTDSALIKSVKSPYTVQNTIFVQKQMEIDNNLKEMNDEWTKILTKDPYVKIAYDVILLMIK